MSLSKSKIKGVVYRFWWHLDSLEAQNASYDILSLFFNAVKEQYPERRRKNPFNSGGELEIFSEDNKELKLVIKNDELSIHMEDILNFNKTYLQSLMSENRDKIIDIFDKLNIVHDHFHQDIILLYFNELGNSDLKSDFKKIGVHLDSEIIPSNKKVENLNLSFSLSNDGLGRINYQIAKGKYKEEVGVVVQNHYVSPKIPTSKNALDKWIDQIISSVN